MSARRRPTVRFTSEARRDYADILLHSRRRWGPDQQATYRSALTRAFGRLVAFPSLGPPRDDLFPGCRGLHVEQHVIYYRADQDEIVLVRLLHQRQDETGLVKEPRG